jgi:hypothetical protein
MRFGFPLAFQRMPPASHTETSLPHGQRISHSRDSRSILSAHVFGKIVVKSLCSVVIRLLPNDEPSHAGPLALD